ncbi:MAG: hypothetical protein H6698_09165 [Myxococcales bacterium]|nr:hypothetical protein [Myxococcales bacterium]MCB9534456.1 hypothetical protein [Myxococcales bacterium]
MATIGSRWTLAACLAGVVACGGGGGGGNDTGVGDDADTGDATVEVDAQPDVRVDAVEEPDLAPDVEQVPPEDVICLPCTSSRDCPGAVNLCLNFPSGERYCGYDCELDRDVCPEGTECSEVINDVWQCIPTDQRCVDLCATVECAEGERCNPDTGVCFRPGVLCDPCTTSEDCGDENDLCLTLADADRSNICASDCTDTECPEGYFCATVNGGTETFQQCVPSLLTCVDRCVDVVCEVEGETCDPRTGLCSAGDGPCAPCSSNFDCGGEEDLCLGLRGGPCATNTDCEVGERCDTGAQVCVGSFCGSDCLLDPDSCPPDYGCFPLDGGGAQCLPLTFSCIERCDGVDCGDGFNCDEQTGACVESVLRACGAPCTSNAECGGANDLCLAFSGGAAACTYECGRDVERPCPTGYDCRLLSNGLEMCLPRTVDFSCAACTSTSCPDGEECNPIDGSCAELPQACLPPAAACPTGELCSFATDRCEPVGTPCSFATRFSDCDTAVLWCTSPRDGIAGTCEQTCFGSTGCDPSRPTCAQFHGTSGSVCVADATGGAHTCGVAASTRQQIGRPCDAAVTDPDVIQCPSFEAPTCVNGGDDRVGGFCSLACTSSDDCGGLACAALPEGNFCVPDACTCVAPIALREGESDVLGDLLAAVGTSRCDLAWTDAERRAEAGVSRADDALQLFSTTAAQRDPLQVLDLFAPQRATLETPTTSRARAALALAATAWGTPIVPPTTPASYGDEPIAEAVNRLATTLGGSAIAADDQAAAAALPRDVAVAVASVVDAFNLGVPLHQQAMSAWTSAELTTLPVAVFRAVADADGSVDPWSAPLSTRLTGATARARLLSAADAVLAAIDGVPDSLTASGLTVPLEIETSVGLVVIAGEGNDTHSYSVPVALIVDLGGDDTYRGAAGANADAAHPFGVVIDLGGSDTYGYDPVPVADDAGLAPSDGAGRATPERLGDGPRSLSTQPRQGAGVFGVGALYDLGPGHDTFESLRASQGFGLFGVGVLVDDGGTADLSVEAYGQGAGLFGVGVVVLGDQEHTTSGYHGVQGFGGIAGVGVMVGGTAGDTYTAVAGDPIAGNVLYFNRLSSTDRNLSAAQGAGYGSRQEDPAGHDGGGGLGLLLDLGGDDTYSAGVGAQGFGRAHGVGLFFDVDGDDHAAAAAYAMGAGTTFGVGLCVDQRGRDQRGETGLRPTWSLGFGNDFGAGLFVDRDGDDRYAIGAFAAGFGRLDGIGLFAELAGTDDYDADSNDTLGRAALTILGREPDTNPRRDANTIGLFVDAGGTDRYVRPDLLSPPVGDDRQWTQVAADERSLRVYGGGIDAVGATGL